MRLTALQKGIISYAGLDSDALWAKAKRAFAQADDEVPSRFSSFLPLFPVELVQNMSYVGSKDTAHARVSPAGFSIDPVEYHQKLHEQMPALYTGENYRRNFDYEGRYHGKGVMAVDDTWATYFPQYQPFLGERLVVYMIGGGHQAVVVPESIYPRGGGVLESAEADMRITERCAHFTAYVKARVARGDRYEPTLFEADYMHIHDVTPVLIHQAELGRVMQDLSIIKSLQTEQPSVGVFTENAKRAEHITQYVPFHYACDTFEAAPITRLTARLLQLHFEGDDFISDLWIPYQDASEYIDKQRMALDVRALCEGFQIAPAYDARTQGGRYPDHVRVAIVRDRDIRLMMADTLNNPAYGSGMSPLGMINKRVFLSESKELLRQHKLTTEDVSITCENTALPPADYRRMRALAELQEHKGKLVDAMYRRESALSQMQPGSRSYERALELLNEKVERLSELVAQAQSGGAHGRGQLSGYDADIDYLRRMQQDREGVPDDETPEPVAFATDALREMSIESGYAMRNGVRSFGFAELYTPPPEDDEDGDEEAEEEAVDEAVEVAAEEAVEDGADAANGADDADADEANADKANVDETDVDETNTSETGAGEAIADMNAIAETAPNDEATENVATDETAETNEPAEADDTPDDEAASTNPQETDEAAADSVEATSAPNASAENGDTPDDEASSPHIPNAAKPRLSMAELTRNRHEGGTPAQGAQPAKMAQLVNKKKKKHHR